MPLTPYLVSFPLPDKPTQNLLFATKTGALVLLPEETFAALQRGEVAAGDHDALVEMGFWVKDQEEEQQQLLQYLDEVNRLNPGLTVAVILGMECNFACRYCYEGAQKGQQAMTGDTANQLVAYLKERFKPGMKKLHFDFYGGETLLYKKRIIDLARQLKPFVEERGGVFSFNLVTNGSLLTPQVVEDLNPLGLDGVKVTVDGPPDLHNYFRPFKSGEGSFDVIVKNLAAISSMTNIRLGGNYTSDNYRHFITVLDLLAERGVKPESIELVNFNPVMKVNDKIAMNEYSGGCAGLHEPWLIEAEPFIREEIFRRGYPLAEPGPSPCAVEVDDAFTVHYDGSLYKCAVLIGHEQYKIGDVENGVNSEKGLQNHSIGHWQREEKCRQCRYLPLCFGGCRYMAYQRDGHMGNVDCKKEFLDATMETTLLQELKYRYGQG